MAHAGSLALLAALALGCTAEGPEPGSAERESSEVVRAGPGPGDAMQATEPIEPIEAIDPGDLVHRPSEPLAEPPSNAPNDEFPLLPGGRPPTLHAVLVRDGPIELLASGEGAHVFIEGEPISLGPAGPRRLDAQGLEHIHARTSLDLRVTGFVETPEGDAYLATTLRVPRGGWYASHTYRRAGGRWGAAPEVREGPFVDDVLALVRHADTVFELRALRLDPELDVDERVRLDASAPATRFIALAGTASLPTLPSRGHVSDVTSDAEGRILALWREHVEPGRWRDDVPKLLVWSPERSTPDIVELPDGGGVEQIGLAPSGADVLVFGSPRYLAIARGRDIRRIRVVLPEPGEVEDDAMAFAGDEIGAAALTSTGELWIALDGHGGQRLLLHRAVGKGWSRVELRPPGSELNPPTRWIHEGAWKELEVEQGMAPEIYALAWSGGRTWIHAASQLITAEGLLAIEREVLYASGPRLAPELLSPIDRRWFEHAVREPDSRCRVVSLILGQRASLTRGQRSALQAYRGRLGSDALVYLGELDGRRELVLQASLGRDTDRSAFARELGEALGLEVHADCRPRDFIALVLDLRSE